MRSIAKESLQLLRDKIDIVDLIGSYVSLKGSGGMYKGLCPFHDEKTPSFTVHRSDGHYHCFGCGAHGDGIAFVMNHAKLSFSEAIAFLAERYHVELQEVEGKEEKGTPKSKLREILTLIGEVYHVNLLHTHQGHQALEYLFKRGIDLDFIQRFGIGYAPSEELFWKIVRKEKWSEQLLEEAGIIRNRKCFFSDRVTFPICDALGHVIGFSARKIDETPGPKYINSPETALFKKSDILFGFQFSRKEIAKKRSALIVEGQIDVLRLIQEGFSEAVASQGTAFTPHHVQMLQDLGVQKVILLFDGDSAGIAAAIKTGNLFQKSGVEAKVAVLPQGEDPDSFLRNKGKSALEELIARSIGYIEFLLSQLSLQFDMRSPAGKSQAIAQIVETIRSWEHPLLVHESLRRLADIAGVPEELLGISKEKIPQYIIKKTGSIQGVEVDAHHILETDLLRWLLISSENREQIVALALKNISEDHFFHQGSRRLFQILIGSYAAGVYPLLSQLPIEEFDAEMQLTLAEVMKRKVNTEKSLEGAKVAIQKMLERSWMEKRETIRKKIQSGILSDSEAIVLAKEFDALKLSPPKVLE